MNAAPRFQLGQLPNALRICARQVHTATQGATKTGSQGPEGHGEKIWVFGHRRSDQIIYTFRPQLDGFHDLKQLTFHGKKTKAAKLRKDYWSPMASIQFAPGQGSVGRSVFQKLRELKHLHEVAWTDDFRYKQPAEFTVEDKKKIAAAREDGKEFRPVRSKQERGAALNAQKTNAIADIAAVLAGQGRGNKVVTDEAEGVKELAPVTVSWANDLDREYAESWSQNVTHELFEEPAYVSQQAVQPVAQAQAAA